MKLAKQILLILAVTLTPAMARAEVGLTLEKSALSPTLYASIGLNHIPIEDFYATNRGRFTGFGWNAEVGLDLPFSTSFGLRAAAAYGGKSLSNTANSNLATEIITAQNFGSKAGILLERFGVGAGLQFNKYNLNSTANNLTSVYVTYSGMSGFIFLNMNLPVASHLGTVIETQFHRAYFGNATTTEVVIQLNLAFIFSGR